jgi:hypothetical protein
LQKYGADEAVRLTIDSIAASVAGMPHLSTADPFLRQGA